MQIAITNTSSPPIALFLPDLYMTLQPGATVTTTRMESDLSRMVGVQNHLAAGDLRITITPTAAELASGLLGVLASPAMNVTVEEFTNPLAAATTNLMAATASVAASVTLLPGAPAVGVLTQATITNLGAAARQIQFTTAGVTPSQQAATATVTGLDVRGRPVVEVVSLANTAATVVSATFFSSISQIVLSAAGGVSATLALGLALPIGLVQVPKSRAGRIAIIQEISAGSVVTNGVVTAPATTAASVTGTVAVTDTVAVVTGTTDVTAAGLYGIGASLDGLTIILNVNGGGSQTLTLNGATNTANEAALLAAIGVKWGTITATAGGIGGNKLVLTDSGATSSIVVGVGTANTFLGLTPGTTISGTTVATQLLTLAFDAAPGQLITFGVGVATKANILSAINSIFGAVATFNASNKLVLTSLTSGDDSFVNVVSGSAAASLGLATGITQGTADGLYGVYLPNSAPNGSTSYCLTYEYVQAA